jgi:hypothetical protein
LVDFGGGTVKEFGYAPVADIGGGVRRLGGFVEREKWCSEEDQ